MVPAKVWLWLNRMTVGATALALAYWMLSDPYASDVSRTSVGTSLTGQATHYVGTGGGRGGLFFPLLVPIALSCLPLLPQTWGKRALVGGIAAIGITAFTILGAFTVGAVYLPAALLAIVSFLSGISMYVRQRHRRD